MPVEGRRRPVTRFIYYAHERLRCRHTADFHISRRRRPHRYAERESAAVPVELNASTPSW